MLLIMEPIKRDILVIGCVAVNPGTGMLGE